MENLAGMEPHISAFEAAKKEGEEQYAKQLRENREARESRSRQKATEQGAEECHHAIRTSTCSRPRDNCYQFCPHRRSNEGKDRSREHRPAHLTHLVRGCNCL
eukprot:scaffold170752_cov33-Tisochrysis_lutea.AAC.1